jgi:hypothetical protein
MHGEKYYLGIIAAPLEFLRDLDILLIPGVRLHSSLPVIYSRPILRHRRNMKKKRVPAPGSTEDLVSQLGVAENDPQAMRIAKISEMKRLGTASAEEKKEWGKLLGELIIEAHARATNK